MADSEQFVLWLGLVTNEEPEEEVAHDHICVMGHCRTDVKNNNFKFNYNWESGFGLAFAL